MEFTTPITPLQRLTDPWLEEHGVEVYIKREDLLHPQLGGNKWRKLKYNLEDFFKSGMHVVLSFGGAYSNHIYALAAAGKIFGFPTIGIIRGELTMPLNKTLKFAANQGMLLSYEDRVAYRLKDSLEYQQSLREKFGEVYLLPEGGTNNLAVKGCAELVAEIDIDFDYLCCACGSGGTLAGLAKGAAGRKVVGFSVLKANHEMNGVVQRLVDDEKCHWQLNHEYHFGGYAKSTAALHQFIAEFQLKNNIPIEHVYTGKMMFGIYDQIHKGYFKRGERVIALHTGGLQNVVD